MCQLATMELEWATKILSEHPNCKSVVETLNQLKRVHDRMNPRQVNPGAQGKLDSVLKELLPLRSIYVDVGAGEARECSNTWQFYQHGGWGLLIEPMPMCWPSILTQRPHDYLWPKAVARQNGWTRFHLCGACSSLDPEWTEEKRGELCVETERLDDILARFPSIRKGASLCSIDTEGTEEDVLSTINWKRFVPKVFVVEYKVFEHPEQSEARLANLHQYLPGYQMTYHDEWNAVYVRKE